MRFKNLVEDLHQVSKITKKDMPEILAMTMAEFGKYVDKEEVIEVVESADLDISRKIEVNGKIVGCYLLRQASVMEFAADSKIDLMPYENMRGVEGLALIVLPAFRGTGLGNILKNVPKSLGYDYVWGLQLKSLNNLDYWLKRRIFVADIDDCWVTMEVFNEPVTEDVDSIKDYLGMVAKIQPTGMDAFIKKYGRKYDVDHATYKGKRGTQKQCFMNAGRLAIANPNLTYVEGYIMFMGIPIHHAWCVTKNNTVVDPTLKNNDDLTVYFGVPFKTDYLNKTILKTKYWGIFDYRNRDLYSEHSDAFLAEDQTLTEDIALMKQAAIKVAKNCQPFLRHLQNEHNKTQLILWHGRKDAHMSGSTPLNFIELAIFNNRMPRDTPLWYHEALNKALKAAGIPCNRSNSLFTTGDKSEAMSYADSDSLYAIFPIGDFKFAWNENIQDFFNYTEVYGNGEEDDESSVEELTKSVADGMRTQDLPFAILSNCEIMICGSKYYAVSQSWIVNNFVGMVWQAYKELSEDINEDFTDVKIKAKAKANNLLNLKMHRAAKLVAKNCQPFLTQANNLVMYHGFGSPVTGKFLTQEIKADRTPRDLCQAYHDHINIGLKEKGIESNRSNSIFCSSSYLVAFYYSNKENQVYAIYPIQSFKFAWSPTVRDAYDYVRNQIRQASNYAEDEFSPESQALKEKYVCTGATWVVSKNHFDRVVKFIVSTMQSTHLHNALKSGNEILISNCNYYAVSKEWMDAGFHELVLKYMNKSKVQEANDPNNPAYWREELRKLMKIRKELADKLDPNDIEGRYNLETIDREIKSIVRTYFLNKRNIREHLSEAFNPIYLEVNLNNDEIDDKLNYIEDEMEEIDSMSIMDGNSSKPDSVKQKKYMQQYASRDSICNILKNNKIANNNRRNDINVFMYYIDPGFGEIEAAAHLNIVGEDAEIKHLGCIDPGADILKAFLQAVENRAKELGAKTVTFSTERPKAYTRVGYKQQGDAQMNIVGQNWHKMSKMIESKTLLEHNVINVDSTVNNAFGYTLNSYLNNLASGQTTDIANWCHTVLKKFLINDDQSCFRLTDYTLEKLKADKNLPNWVLKSLDNDPREFMMLVPRDDQIHNILHFLEALYNELADGTNHQREVEITNFFDRIKNVSFNDMVLKAQQYFNAKKTKKEEHFVENDFKTVLTFGDGWKWVWLTSEEGFKKAGRVLQNCIGSYYHYDERGRQRIYILLDNKNKGHVAVRIDHYFEGSNSILEKDKWFDQLEEIKGKQNTSPAEEYKQYCAEFIKKFVNRCNTVLLKSFGLVFYKDDIVDLDAIKKQLKLELYLDRSDFEIPYKVFKYGPEELAMAIYSRSPQIHPAPPGIYKVLDLNGNLLFGFYVSVNRTKLITYLDDWNLTQANVDILNDLKPAGFTISDATARRYGLYLNIDRPLSTNPIALLPILEQEIAYYGNAQWRLHNIGDYDNYEFFANTSLFSNNTNKHMYGASLQSLLAMKLIKVRIPDSNTIDISSAKTIDISLTKLGKSIADKTRNPKSKTLFLKGTDKLSILPSIFKDVNTK